MDCLMSLKAFLAPFKVPKHWKHNTDRACAADDEESQYAYETGDTDIARKVNALLEGLHVDDNDNDEMAWEDIDLEVVEEEAAEVDDVRVTLRRGHSYTKILRDWGKPNRCDTLTQW